jgi:esterase
MNRSQLRHRKVMSEDVTLAVRDSGNEEAPVVVFLSGLGAPQRAWDRVIARLANRSRIITYDYRGHGKSSAAARYTFDGFLRDLDAVLNDVSPRNPVFCGWSFGADLAVRYAAEHRDSGIAGIVAVDGGIPAEMTGIGESDLRRQIDSPWVRAMGRLMVMTGVGVRLSTDELLALMHDADRYRAEIIEAYKRLDIPVSVILGSRPPRSPDGERLLREWQGAAERLVSTRPGVTVTWVDSDHAVPLRRPDQVADLIKAMATTSR